MSNPIILHFAKPGLQTLIQDYGRPGYQAWGVPPGGYLDAVAAETANWLVGNPRSGPVLEIALMGPRITFAGDAQIALAGADLSATLNGRPATRYRTLDVRDGDLLQFGSIQSGCRAYLAVRGQWQVKQWLHSASAATQKASQLTPDSLIAKGSQLRILPEAPIPPRDIPPGQWPAYGRHWETPVLPGPEFELASRQVIARFFSMEFRIRPESNRMGYRLEGAIAGFRPPEEIISSGIVPGTVQLTHAGQPIILLRDAQTTGGYFRLANVTTDGQHRLAQAKPGDTVRFVMDTAR